MIMQNGLYDALRFVAELLLPALGVFYVAIAKIWGLPYGEAIAGTLAALDTLLGAFVKWCKSKYDKKKEAEK